MSWYEYFFFTFHNFQDAEACELTYAPVIEAVGDIVDLNVNYIAEVEAGSETGFNCMHGQDEVSRLITIN